MWGMVKHEVGYLSISTKINNAIIIQKLTNAIIRVVEMLHNSVLPSLMITSILYLIGTTINVMVNFVFGQLLPLLDKQGKNLKYYTWLISGMGIKCVLV